MEDCFSLTAAALPAFPLTIKSPTPQTVVGDQGQDWSVKSALGRSGSSGRATKEKKRKHITPTLTHFRSFPSSVTQFSGAAPCVPPCDAAGRAAAEAAAASTVVVACRMGDYLADSVK